MGGNFEQIIDKALRNELSNSEKAEFNSLMKSENFQKEYEFFKSLKNVAKIEGRTILKKHLQSLENRKTVKLIPFRKYLFPAAAVVLLLIISILVIPNISGSNQKALFAEYFEPIPPINGITRGENELNPETIAFTYYQTKDYELAIEAFRKTSLSSNEKNLYTGISNMELEHFDLAINNFQEIINGEDVRFKTEANWYLALCYLFIKEADLLESQLLFFENQDGFYARKAKELRSNIE